MLNAELTKTERQIKSILSGPALGELGRKTGFVQRRREVTTLGFVASLLKSLATRKIESMADLCRDFNADHDKTINYKPYYNRLDSPGFPKLMATLFEDMMSTLYHQALKPLKCGPFAAFKDIVIHDGTSFQLHDDLAKIFPGRFTTISPAAVELHVTMSLFYDQPICVVATGDKECERHYAPEAKDLSGKLFLAWAALCAAFLKRYFAHTCQRVSGRTPISTRRVAMSSHVFMDRFCACWLRGFRGLTGVLVNIVTFLEHNAKRSNPGRERTRGRLTLGLETAGVSGEG
jgi:hypothetical protein